MQEVLAASGQTQPVSFLSAITRSEMELEFLRAAEGVSAPCPCQALQAQQSFIPASTCRVQSCSSLTRIVDCGWSAGTSQHLQSGCDGASAGRLTTASHGNKITQLTNAAIVYRVFAVTQMWKHVICFACFKAGVG